MSLVEWLCEQKYVVAGRYLAKYYPRDTSLHAQTSQSELVSAFRNQVRWIPDINGLNPLKKYNPVRPFVYWYNTRKMNGILGKVLDDRFASRKANEQSQSSMSGKPIIDLALDNYLNDGTQRSSNTIDPTFKEFSVDQIKLFLFAGHDTTSTTACYVYHLLSKNPSALHRVRKELDHVLGLDIAQGPRTLAENPHLLNQLNYSNAVIKEALRLYPPVSSARTGKPGYFLEHDGVKYPTEGFLVCSPDLKRNATNIDSSGRCLLVHMLCNEGRTTGRIRSSSCPSAGLQKKETL